MAETTFIQNEGKFVDLTILNDYKARGLVISQAHQTLPLLIWNYSNKVTFRKEWDEVTRLARGLITDNVGNIVGRSFRKFGNEFENIHEASSEFDIMEKMDGSLGILFVYEGEWMVTSRGSFHSEQALKAQQLIDRKYNLSFLNKSLSYVLEIIYPENQIVVDYGATEELVVLAAFQLDGTEVYPLDEAELESAKLPSVKKYPELSHLSILELKALDRDNHEGFVVRYSNGQRVKVKFENYFEMHRIRSAPLNMKQVFELFYAGDKSKLDFIPDYNGRKEYFLTQYDGLQRQFDALSASVQSEFDSLGYIESDKAFSAAVSKSERKELLHMLRRNKCIRYKLCAMLKLTEV